MSSGPPSQEPPPLEPTERLHAIRARFAANLQAGCRPRLEEFLAQLEPGDRPALLRELLALDLADRARQGERPTAEEYRLRLPGHVELVDAAFGLLSSTSHHPPPSPTPRGDASPPLDQPGAATQGRRGGGLTDSGAGLASTGEVGFDSGTSPVRAGRYEIEGEIGRGGMGVVLRARDPDLNRALAVKVLRADYRGRPALERRFREEAQITGQLQHPGIPPVHEVGVLPDGRPFFAMRLVRGRTLAELLQDRTEPGADLPRLLGIFEQVCQTLAYAHSNGVVHRDLKPANVMVGAFGEVQVMDWGLAKVLASRGCQAPEDGFPPGPDGPGSPPDGPGSPAEETLPGTVLGTPAYMAPEQARGEVDQLDERCDVFGLGAILCVLLTGQPPYCGRRDEVHARAGEGDLGEALERLRYSGADVPLIQLAFACLSPAKELRPRDAGVVAEAMSAYLAGVQERVREAERQRAAAEARAVEERKRRRLALALAGALLLLILAGGCVAWLLRQERDAALARQRETDQKILLTLEQARRRVEEARQASDTQRLRDEADRVGELVRSGGASPAVRQQLIAFHRQAKEFGERAARNRALLDDLLNVWFPQETVAHVSDDRGQLQARARPSVDSQYAEAFQRWGLDIDGTPESEVIARVQAQPEAVVQEVVAGLDTWMVERRRQKPRRAEVWRRLFRIAGALDRSRLGGRLRALLAGAPPRPIDRLTAGLTHATLPWTRLYELERGQDWRLLLELRGQLDLGAEATTSILLLSAVCGNRGDRRGAEELLRRAVEERPNQAVLQDALGRLLDRQGPRRRSAAIERYAAARALRPQLGVSLGQALLQAGRAEEGEAVLSALVRRDPNNPSLRFHQGEAHAQRGRPAEARAAYEAALRLKPNFPGALNNLGLAWWAEGNLPKAMAAFRAALRIQPDLPQAHNNLGGCLRAQGKLPEAVAAISKGIQYAPQLAIGYYNRGAALAQQHKFAEAETDLRKAVRLRPHYPKAFNTLGLVLREQDRFAEAVTALRESVRLDPTVAETHNNLGDALLDLRELKGAEAAFREAIRLQPDFPWAWTSLGTVLCLQERWSEAVAAHRQALRLRRNFPDAYLNLGETLRRWGKPSEAVEAFTEALRLKPDFPEVSTNLGTVLVRQGKLSEARAAFEKALRQNPNLAEAHQGLGLVWLEEGKLDQAIKAFENAVHRKPNLAVALHGLGVVWLRLGKPAQAVAVLQQATRLDPTFAEAHTNLGEALQALGKLEQARAAHQRAIELNPTLAEAHNNLGRVLAAQEKLPEAEAAFRTAIRLKPDLAVAHTNLGTVLRAQGRPAQAIAAHREAIRRKPDVAQTYASLGNALYDEGKFREALEALRKAHALGSGRPGWPTALHLGNIRSMERALELDRALPEFLAGKRQPSGRLEQFDLAFLCGHRARRLYTTSARYYASALAAKEPLPDDFVARQRFDAARVAVLAGCGEGEDAGKLGEEERALRRKQALAWLRADLAAWEKQMASGQPQPRAVLRALTHWQKHRDLEGVRGAEGLKRLPEDERAAWQQLWAEVAALVKRAERR
jgi:serine/threonine-protein kinase